MAQLQVDFFSRCLMRQVTINAIVPVDKLSKTGQKVREDKPFKTLYLLHGIYGNHNDWITGTRIAAWAQENNLAVIMPAAENHFYVDCKASGEEYGAFIGEELIEVTRALFPLSKQKEDTFIAGLSMGGYGAIRNGLKYWNTFGYIAGLSSAFILENALNSTNDTPIPFQRRSFFEAIFGDLNQLMGSDMDYKALILDLKKQDAQIPSIYLAIGTEDFLLQPNRDYHHFLIDQGVEVTYEEGPGGHEWNFWDRYIHHVLEWLPLEDNSKGINSGNVANE